MGRFLISACAAFLAVLVAAPSANAAICTSSSGCEFWDENYHELILYKVDTGQIDVLIVPPASGTTLWDLPAIEQGIAAWDSGIDALGPAWLADGVNIDSYVVGTDVAPESALLDPEIIVYSAAFNPFVLFGIGLQAPFSFCRQQSEAASFAHQHPGSDWLVQTFACEDGGIQCHVINTNFLTGTTRQMYDLNAHEVGHCLGIGHVGDALDFDAKRVPLTDIMSYQNNEDQVHCVSSLNILALQEVYEPVLGAGPGQQPLTYVHMAPSSYTQVSCTNPADGLWVSSSMDADPMKPVEAIDGLGLTEDLGAQAWDPVAMLTDEPLLGLF